jgi:hypothetical protein
MSCMPESNKEVADIIDGVTKALRRAYQLGQKYWQQADSESWIEQDRSDETYKKFVALCDETRKLLISGEFSTALVAENTVHSEPIGFASCVEIRNLEKGYSDELRVCRHPQCFDGDETQTVYLNPAHRTVNHCPAMEAIKALRLILPLAKGYVAKNNVGNNREYIEMAEEAAKFEEALYTCDLLTNNTTCSKVHG